MLTSLYTGITGINAHMNELSVIGHNIANMNTHGFKASRSYFADLMDQSLQGITGPNQVGSGVSLSSVVRNFTQGAFETTANPLDLAIEGSGFFVVTGPDEANYYTRAGQFLIDEEGYIVDPNGLRLQGYMVDGTGNLLPTPSDLQISLTSYPPQATANVSLVANLDSESTILPAFDLDDMDGTTNFQTTVTVYDSLGNAHPVNLCFRKVQETAAGSQWEWYAVVEGEDAASGTREVAAQGTLLFNTSGALQDESPITYPGGGFNFSGGAAQNQEVEFDFGTNIDTEGGTGLDGVTQYSGSSGLYALQQDGYATGSLQGITINEEGILTGSFDNGRTRTLGQVALANFASPSGLRSMGKNLFVESHDSGPVVVGKPRGEGMGSLRPNTLELSNVDLATEFVEMITAQRGFQANSKVITTTDEVLAELVNLKR